MNKQGLVTIWKIGRGPAVVALVAWLGVLAAIDPAGDYHNAPQGPGVTLDEWVNVEQGVILATALSDYGLAILHPESVAEVFGSSVYKYNPDHPPLGRLWIGLSHELAMSLAPPAGEHWPFVTACARTAPATAFALQVFLVGLVAGRWFGKPAGWAAATALVLMPRVFGHAHVAALESFIGLTYAAAVLSVAHFWRRSPAEGPAPHRDRIPPSAKVAIGTGCVFGLALLTKIQAVLIPIPLAAWALWRWRWQAVVPVVLWGVSGLVILFMGWPWLWLAPWEHFQEYLGRTTGRIVIHVWYFGQRLADRDVPWHYPFVMFLVTVPIGLHALGAVGLLSRRNGGKNMWRKRLLVFCTFFPLMLFAIPGVTVYDGVRLFLVVFPLWAVLIGSGFVVLKDWLAERWSPARARWALTAFLALQGYGLIAFAPCHLSYYNALAGGLWGADRLGLPPTYWGDSLTRSFLDDVAESVPPGTSIEVVPVLHPYQLQDLWNQAPILRARNIQLHPIGSLPPAEERLILYFRRKADLPSVLREPPQGGRLLAEVRRQGVQLAALYRLPSAVLEERPRPTEPPQSSGRRPE